MNTMLKSLFVSALVLVSAAFSVRGLIPDDADGDGVPDSVDVCPGEDSSPFDRDGDGCIDDFIGGRHIEYWGVEDASISYQINEQGVPSITNGSDLTAVQSAVSSWTSLADTDLNVVYGGTTTQTNSNGLDGTNLVTFVDNAFPFSSLVLAVGLSTSFEADTLIDGRVYRQGEIFDADMVFNPTKTFTVGGVGGVDIQSVATHEAGHLFGISHSAIQSSTMFYVLPGGVAARSLEADDELVYFKAYGDPNLLATANRIDVLVRDGQTNQPLPGAIVFIIDAQTQDTTGCDYTLADGTATFPGLDNGGYFVSIYPLNGTSPIGFIQPGNINALIADIATENFVPEYFDAAESNKDDSAARTEVSVGISGPVASVNLFTNIDASAPTVISASPANGSNNVAIDGAYRVQFSEPVEISTLSSAFSFRDLATSTPQPGTLAILLDDSVVVFIPSPPLTFSTQYRLTFDTDLEDQFGNALAADYNLDITTEAEPPVSLSSLAPNKGVVGATFVINGQGFELGATVDFAGIPAPVVSLANHRIVTNVPAGAATGVVTVTNPDLSVSNGLTFTVLTQAEVARGYETGETIFTSTPRAIALTPNGDYAYVATAAGAEAVVVNPSATGYLVGTPIPFGLGLDDIAVSPLGTRAYAVSASGHTLVEINTDPTAGLLFNTILSERPIGAQPRGLVVDPSGDRAYIATDESEVQVWDTRLGSPTYRLQIGTIAPPLGDDVTGAMAMTPSGDRLMYATESGTLAFYDPVAQTAIPTVDVGLGARSIIVDPMGARAYVTHDDGDISVVNIQGNPFEVQDVVTGGSLRGLAITPGASYFYAADRVFDDLKVVDLVETNSTFRSVVAEITADVDPVDVAISPDGFFAFSLLQGDGANPTRMQVSTIGVGPSLTLIHPIAGPAGTIVVLRGTGFAQGVTAVSVNFNGVVVANAHSGLHDEIVVHVPTDATTGQVTVEVTLTDGSVQISNPVNFTVLSPTTSPLRFAATLEPNTSSGAAIVNDMEVSPKGDVLFIRYNTDIVEGYDIRPSSVDFHRQIAQFSPGANVVDLAITADGKTCFTYLFGAGGGGNALGAFVSDPNDPEFAKLRPFLVSGPFGAGGGFVRTSPNNIHVVVFDNELNDLTLFDARFASQDGIPTLIAPLSLAANVVMDVAFHPSGRALYVATDSPPGVQVFDTDPRTAGFGNSLQFLPVDVVGNPPLSFDLDARPDGLDVFGVMVEQTTGATTLFGFPINPLSGYQIEFINSTGVDFGPPLAARAFRIVANGNRGVRASSDGFEQFDLDLPYLPILPTIGAEDNTEANDFDFTPDGTRMYVASPLADHVRAYDFAADGAIVAVSGDDQAGVMGTQLAAPVRVRVTPIGSNLGIQGIPVTFEAQTGNGFFRVPCEDGPGLCLRDHVIVATDENGFAEAEWFLYPTAGPQTVEALADGIAGSPVIFNATAVADPATLPLTVAEVIPLDNSTNVSVSTSALVTFSRAIDPSTIDPTSLFIQSVPDATLIPVAYGFTSEDSRVSLTPLVPLSPSTDYQIVSTSTIQGDIGDALTNPGTTIFATQAPPPLAIASIAPPSAIPGTPVVIAGTGFTNGDTVNFGALAVTGTGTSVALTAIVPAEATLGTVNVTVSNGIATSNALPFTVLQVTTTVIDDVIANIASGSAKSIVVSADGALCYAVGTEGDVVIPVGIEDQVTHPSIPVGDQPVAIVINAAGDLAYVANFNSGSVSVIDVDDESPTYHSVITTILVGSNPIDVAVDPDGSRLAVANAGSNDVSIVDTDATSLTYNQVTSTITMGSSAKSVVISGDGTLYVGTSNGIYVVDQSNNVVATVGPGSSAKSIITSADGSLLFALTDSNEILVIDIQDGSPSENQVVATIGAGSSAKSIITSADGSLLYIVQEDTDEVLVLAIEIIPGVGAIDPDAASFTVVTTVAGTLATGDDPSDVAIDPRGSGRVVVANAGDGTLRVFGPGFGPIAALFELEPKTLNTKSKGKYVSGLIQLAPPHSVREIDVSTIRIFDTIFAIPGSESIGDKNADGIDDLSVLFCRAEVIAALPPNTDQVVVTVIANLGGGEDEEIIGTTPLRVRRPKVFHPTAAEKVPGGQPLAITWSTPNGLHAEAVNLEWSTAPVVPTASEDCETSTADDEALGAMEVQTDEPNVEDTEDEWQTIAFEVENTGSYTWSVPAEYHPQARLRVTLVSRGNKAGESIVPVSIELTVPTRLKSFDVSIEDGAAVLRWETTLETGLEGFAIVRSESETGHYADITEVVSSGSATGGTYEVRDDGVSGNRSYWYKLREVSEDGLGAEYGPYSVTYRVTNSLSQNHPNPFNPTTTIAYSIAADDEVHLLIYDVAGRKVKTLVHERQEADLYKVVWDGSNDAGTRVASGVYFYQLVAGKFTQTKKMVLLK